ncbi:MAG: response regulator [Gammaproteobacteria bacterium]
MSEKILIVDDEPRVLTGIKRGLHGLHKVLTADSGSEGLRQLAENPDIAIVISDMRMPRMDGIEFLTCVRTSYPTVVRMMLTGNNDQDTAKTAVNAGAVFRFLNKPCTRESLTEALDSALEQFRLQRAEQDVLERTMGASVSLMADILSMIKPGHFGSIGRLVNLSTAIARRMGGVEVWAMHAAATLSTLGYLTVSEEVIDKRRGGAALTADELDEFNEHAKVGARMVEKIPRMADVASIIRHQNTRFADADTDHSEPLPLAARILHVAIEFDLLRLSGKSTQPILAALEEQDGEFDPGVLNVLRAICQEENFGEVVLRVDLKDLEIGMVIEEDIVTNNDVLVVFAGQPVTIAVISHLEQLAQTGALSAQPLVRTQNKESLRSPEIAAVNA